MNLVFQALAIILTLVAANTQALSLNQSNSCPTQMINFQGKCFDRIIGCQIYKSGTHCQKCDQTSTLTDGKCLMNTQIYNPQIFANLPLKATSLKGAAIPIKLNFVDQANFNTIKNIIVTKYPLFENAPSDPFIQSVMKSSFDTYILFTWTNSKNRKFLFEFGISSDGTTTELISDDWDQNLQNSAFKRINAKLTQKYTQQLMGSTLTRIVAISRNLFKLHYYSDFGFHYVAFLQKIPFLEIKPLQTIMWKYEDQEMLNYVYSQHPFLLTEPSWNIQKRDNQNVLQYQIKFKSQSQVVLEQIPGQRQRIIFFKREENQTLSPLSKNSKIVGGFQLLRDTSDQNVRKVLDHLFGQFTILKNMEIVKIEYQLVAGVIYLIHLKDKSKSINEEYISKVFYSLQGEINILEIYLNSILIHSQPLAPLQINSYEFMVDPVFQDVDRFMRSRVGLKLPTKILYVNRILKSNELSTFYLFQIVYESNSFIEASYFTEGSRKGTIELNDFIYNGDNQLDEEDKTQIIQEVKDFLQGFRAWLDPLVIEYLKETKPNQYLLKIMTEFGSYYMKVINTEITGYEIYYYELIDEKENCLTHSNDELQQFLLVQKPFISGIMNNYNTKIDTTFQLVSFSEGILNSKTRYRLLFVNPADNRKMQVLAHQEGRGLVVDSVSDENNGLYGINDVYFYAKAVQKASLTFPDVLKDSKPIYGMMNSTNVLVYFSKLSDQKESVILVLFDISLQKGVALTLIEQEVSKTCTNLDTKGNCQECKANSLGLMSRCYEQIKNCQKQIGTFCLSCENEYSLVGNICTNDCGMLM